MLCTTCNKDKKELQGKNQVCYRCRNSKNAGFIKKMPKTPKQPKPDNVVYGKCSELVDRITIHTGPEPTKLRAGIADSLFVIGTTKIAELNHIPIDVVLASSDFEWNIQNIENVDYVAIVLNKACEKPETMLQLGLLLGSGAGNFSPEVGIVLGNKKLDNPVRSLITRYKTHKIFPSRNLLMRDIRERFSYVWLQDTSLTRPDYLNL
jgi:hypothetical protein